MRRRRSDLSRSRVSRPLRLWGQLRLLRTLLLVVGCLALWALFNVENLRQLSEAQADRDTVAATVESLRASLGQMQAEREALNTNLRAIERAAREQFKFTYPGEQLVLIERETPVESRPQASEEIDDIESLTNLPEAL